MKRRKFQSKLMLVMVILILTAMTAAAQTVVCGDVNEDGSVNIVDALITAQCYVGLIECPDEAAADVNCDGSVNIVDALQIAQYYVGVGMTLNCCATEETPTPTPTITPTPSPTPSGDPELYNCLELPEWNAGTTYDTPGTLVYYNGYVYSNSWYTSDTNPEENSGEFDVWVLLGMCDPDLTPSPTPTPTPTRDPNETPVPGSDAVDFSQQMGVGWNLGNSMESMGPGNETAWGNPTVNQTLINSVKAAGFDTLRVPVAWSAFSDESTYTIDPAWLARVEEVINYGLNAGMYVMINEHWDGGWLNQPLYANQDDLNERLAIMWEQIAEYFIDYDENLIFAGTNEVMMENDWSAPTQEYADVQNSFNQTFVSTVRATGGNNASRYLVVQAFNTNIDHAINFFVLPQDTIANRLMVEVHYYDPYNFTLNSSSSITEWPSTEETWANEPWCDAQMERMQSTFVNNGVGVILGEYCVLSRLSVSGFEQQRINWNQYITQQCLYNFIVPVYWDNGYPGNDGASGLFDRETGEQVFPDLIDAIVNAAN